MMNRFPLIPAHPWQHLQQSPPSYHHSPYASQPLIRHCSDPACLQLPNLQPVPVTQPQSQPQPSSVWPPLYPELARFATVPPPIPLPDSARKATPVNSAWPSSPEAPLALTQAKDRPPVAERISPTPPVVEATASSSTSSSSINDGIVGDTRAVYVKDWIPEFPNNTRPRHEVYLKQQGSLDSRTYRVIPSMTQQLSWSWLVDNCKLKIGEFKSGNVRVVSVVFDNPIHRAILHSYLMAHHPPPWE